MSFAAYEPPRSTIKRHRTKNCREKEGAFFIKDGDVDSETIVQEPFHMGSRTKVCPHCLAWLFEDEPDSMCCAGGDVDLPRLRPLPEFFHKLYHSMDPKAKDFRQWMNSWNNLFTLTSTKMNRPDLPNSGPPSFVIQGQPYNRRHGFMEAPYRRDGTQKPPGFLQLYLLNADEALDIRDRNAQYEASDTKSKYFKSKDAQELLSEIDEWLKANNEAVQKFRMCHEQQLNHPDQQMCVVFEDRGPSNQHSRRWNLPARHTGMCGIISNIDDLNRRTLYRDIVVKYRKPKYGRKELFEINENHPAYDPLHYVLLFPRGETTGWELYLVRNKSKRRLTSTDFYRFRFMERKEESNHIFRSGLLFQKYAVDMYCKVLAQNLRWHRKNQDKLRAATYQNIREAQQYGTEDTRIGQKIILPATVRGSDRHVKKKFLDFMAIVREYGPPTFFFTMTCNPEWPEILECLTEGQKPWERFDIACRVFRKKMQQAQDDLYKYGVLGKAIAKISVTEFQKRGLPHAHMLIFLHPDHKIRCAEDVDKVVCSEIPDRNKNPKYALLLLLNLLSRVAKHFK